MNIDLSGKKALVGGATSGLGKAIALQLAACGAEVYLMGRNIEKLQQTVLELEHRHGQNHSFFVTDFSNHTFHKQQFELFFESHQVDILVNNTQGPAAGSVMEKGNVDFDAAFQLLFQNAVFATNVLLPSMRKNGFGRVINVSSMTVKEPADGLVLSNTMRTALVSWSKSLANAVGKDGVTVNTVLTGSFDTDRLSSLMRSQAEQTGQSLERVRHAKEQSIPVGRLGKAEEYGYLVAFLASRYADFVNGVALPLDGGANHSLF